MCKTKGFKDYFQMRRVVRKIYIKLYNQFYIFCMSMNPSQLIHQVIICFEQHKIVIHRQYVLQRKLQMQLMYLGLESLYQDSATEREFGSLTLSLSEKEFEEIKFKLRQMRKALHKENAIARMSSKGERVYQLNLQLFPVSNPSKKLN